MNLWPGFPRTNWVLPEPPNHEVGQVQLQSLIRWEWRIRHQTQAEGKQFIGVSGPVPLPPQSAAMASWEVVDDELRKKKLKPG